MRTTLSVSLMLAIGCDFSGAPLKYDEVQNDVWCRKVQKPSIRIARDGNAYQKLLEETLSKSVKEKLEMNKVDFEQKQIVAIYWGLKATTGYRQKVVGVFGNAETVEIRIATTCPKPNEAAGDAFTQPYVIVATPKSAFVRVVVTGDRCDDGGDFKNVKTKDYEVIVK